MEIISLGLILLFIYLSCMVALAQFKGDTSIVNFTWGGGVMLVSLYTLFTLSSFYTRQILVVTLITFWATRLIVHIYARYTGDDPRFAGWQWQGFKALFINMFWVYGQIFIIAIMSSPVLVIMLKSAPTITLLDIVGLCVWIFGFCYEVISDYQLYMFMKKPHHKGHVLQSGLWRYSRHPNYFGEIVMWWGIYLIALSVPLGWVTIIAPITITCLLMFFSGIPWIEKALKHNREYQEYKKKTNMLIPWFPKK